MLWKSLSQAQDCGLRNDRNKRMSSELRSHEQRRVEYHANKLRSAGSRSQGLNAMEREAPR